uniref:Male-enhanced antigen 1 n=1 Tax=Strongyloides stercoralis TaxID=6248 RepID=A0A0K0E9V2_STRER
MSPNNLNEDDLNNLPNEKYIENVEDQNSDSDGWVPTDFEIQIVGRSNQTYSLDDNLEEDVNNFSCTDNESESSWPDTDEEYSNKINEESYEGYTSIPLIIEENNSLDTENEVVTDKINTTDFHTTNILLNNVLESVKRETESVHLSSKDFDYTPVDKKEFTLDDEVILKIKDVMKKIKITPPPWADKINDEKFSEIVKDIIK